MLSLGISLLFNIFVWSAVFFLLRKIQSARTNSPTSGSRPNGARYGAGVKSYSGKMTANAVILLPMFCFFLVLVFVVFFVSPQITSWTGRVGGTGFVLISFLAYVFLLRAIVEGRKP